MHDLCVQNKQQVTINLSVFGSFKFLLHFMSCSHQLKLMTATFLPKLYLFLFLKGLWILDPE